MKNLLLSWVPILFGGFFLTLPFLVFAYGSACSEYGLMAYESGGYCQCMSGYVMSEDFIGNPQCVSGDAECRDRFGWGAEYDSLSRSCECSYGYTWGENLFGESECVTEDQACKDQLGFHSRATFGGNCECSYGYIIDGGECKDGDQVCRADHGYYSSYDSLSNKCECDDDYTFDDDYQCVEKQHNVYFQLLDINPEDDNEILIKSDYDYRMYIVRLGFGCFGTSISQYENGKLVVNLGTDYELDTWDTVVLQDHNQTCSIVSRERTFEDSFPEPEEDEVYYFTPTAQTYDPLTLPYSPSDQDVEESVELPTEEPIPNTEIEYVINERGRSMLEESSGQNEVLRAPSSSVVESVKEEGLIGRIIRFVKKIFN